jgi:hypothetical protein
MVPWWAVSRDGFGSAGLRTHRSLFVAGFAYICVMTKLIALLAALTVTAVCGMLALYAARLSLLMFLHWQAWVAVSLLFYASIFVMAKRSERRAEREATKDETLREL